MAQVTLVLYSVKHYGYYITVIPRKIEILFNTLEHAYQTATKQDYIIINKLNYNPKEKKNRKKYIGKKKTTRHWCWQLSLGYENKRDLDKWFCMGQLNKLNLF